MNQPIRDLIAAFVASEQTESVAALVDEEGFDLETIKVLVAWMNGEHRWVEPKSPAPDDGRPTQRAWAWLVSGMALDYVAVADAAGVARAAARSKLAKLLGNRLVYPDGQIAKVARAALQSAVARRLKLKERKGDPGGAKAN